MITVYGTAWCDDTRRAMRLLRRLGVPHRFLNIDEDLEALERAMALTGGWRRTPVIDLGLGGQALVEPDNDTLMAALVEVDMLSQAAARSRLDVQNVGDVERAARTVAGLTVLAMLPGTRGSARYPVGLLGAVLTLTGVTGWCPAYHAAGVTSLEGPGDRPDEARRHAWLTRRGRDSGNDADRLLPSGGRSR